MCLSIFLYSFVLLLYFFVCLGLRLPCFFCLYFKIFLFYSIYFSSFVLPFGFLFCILKIYWTYMSIFTCTHLYPGIYPFQAMHSLLVKIIRYILSPTKCWLNLKIGYPFRESTSVWVLTSFREMPKTHFSAILFFFFFFIYICWSS